MVIDERYHAGVKLDSLVKQRLGETFTAEEYSEMLTEVCLENPLLFEAYQAVPHSEGGKAEVANTRPYRSESAGPIAVGGGFEGIEGLLAKILDQYFDSRLKWRR